MKNSVGKTLISIGLLLLVTAFCLTVYNILDSFRAGYSSLQAVNVLEEKIPTQMPTIPEEVIIPDYILNPHMEMPIIRIDDYDYIGVLSIPALELELPVMDKWSYPKLKIAPCRYSGSAYEGNFVIAAHNYVSHFGKLSSLSEGDTAFFVDVDGNVFTYKMVIQEMLKPTDMEEMLDDRWSLTLFTCTVGGKNRVVNRFERVDTLNNMYE